SRTPLALVDIRASALVPAACSSPLVSSMRNQTSYSVACSRFGIVATIFLVVRLIEWPVIEICLYWLSCGFLMKTPCQPRLLFSSWLYGISAVIDVSVLPVCTNWPRVVLLIGW